MILNIHSPTGGTGCTTIAVSIAAALANRNETVALLSADNDMCHVLGINPTHDQAAASNINVHCSNQDRLDAEVETQAELVDHVVVDRGTGPHANRGSEWRGTVLTVVPNCYLSLRNYTTPTTTGPHHIIFRDTPERALTISDVATTVGAEPVITIRTDRRISRAIDAGLLLARTPPELSNRIEALIDLLLNQERTP